MEFAPVIAAVGKYIVGPIKKHCGYLISYNGNTKDLGDKIKMLRARRDGMQLIIEEEKRKEQLILPDVETWLEEVRILEESVERNNSSLDGWWPRYSTSKSAKKMTLKIDRLLSHADPFYTKVSYPPPSVMISFPVKDIKDFDSRTKKMNEVLEALRDDKVNLIAICGMGGIGKTSMAKVIANRAKFDKVALAVVSQNKDESKIQDKIAGALKHPLGERDPLHERAENLKTILTKDESVLVILDDVWEELNLEEIGIPYGGQHKRCKILLTSRNVEVCNQMKSEKIVKIEVLSKEEAWNLFREMAGDCVDNIDLRQIAEEVAKECGGLPVAIVTVGRALEKKGKDEWIAALQDLKDSIPKNIRGLSSKVYSCIELSYKYLESDEAKSCFLLCCLFPEDCSIPIEHLVRSMMGRRLFTKIGPVAVARNRVNAIVKNLKRSFLLLDSEEGEQFVKMHDVVRDVAISIAENEDFLVRCNEEMEEWPEKDSCERCTAISLVSKELKRHPDGFECPELKLLQLASKINNWYELPLLLPLPLPPNLFKGMKGLKVLSLFGMSFPSLPQSINVLQNLRTLHFVHCEIIDVSAIGELRKLEILGFINSKIKELPGEMRNLSCLKLLELTRCSDLERIPLGLLSSLSHLEELYMLGVDVQWKPMEEEEEDEEANASLTELMSLSYLVAFKIRIPNFKVLPKDFPFKNETIKFQILAGYNEGINEDDSNYLFKNSLGLRGCDISDIAESGMFLQLLKKAEILKLEGIKGLKNIVYELDNEGFQCLKVLEVKWIRLEYVMDATSNQTPRAAFPTLESLKLNGLSKLKEIYHSQFPERSFSGFHSQPPCFGKLTSIDLCACNRLKTVFSLSIARGLVQLQELDISFCGGMEECFRMEGEDEKALIDKIMFPQLTSIVLDSLPRFISFCRGSVGPVELFQPSLNQEVLSINFPKVIVFKEHKMIDDQPNLEKPELEDANSDIGGDDQPNLEILELEDANSDIGGDDQPNLEILELEDANSDIGGVTDLEKHKMIDVQQHTGPFPESTSIISHKLFSANTILWVPNLENLKLEIADSLEVLFDLEGLKANKDHQSIAILAQLRTLTVIHSSKLTYVWKNVPLGIQGFQKLASIDVSSCPRLRYLFPTSIAKLLVELQSIKIRDCDAIENIVQRDGEEEATDIKAYSFEWSSIKEIHLNRCPKLKTIGSEIQSPRKSKKINRELDSRPNEQELWSPGFVWRCLECVPCRKNDGLMVVSDQGTTNKSQRSYSVKEEGTLGKPNDPKVGDSNNPSEIWSLFPSHIIECLKNLELIELTDVPSPEVIFQLEELNVEESHMAPVLDQFRELDLTNLPKLKHIWKKGPERIMGFGNLRLLKVHKCDSLTYLFLPSIAKLFVMLEQITVSDCKKIEQILAIAGEEEEKDVLFHKVNSILLCDLPNLKCFCYEANALKWPSLKEITVINCPSFSTFIPSELITPKLEGVYISYLKGEGMCRWEGDLNATIKHIFKGKEKQANHETQQEEQIETIEEDT